MGAEDGCLGVAREESVMMGLWRSMRRLELRWTVDDEEELGALVEVRWTEVAAWDAQSKSIPLMFTEMIGIANPRLRARESEPERYVLSGFQN